MICRSQIRTARALCAAPAALAGGARTAGGRGCSFVAAFAFAVFALAAAAQQAVPVPSGQPVTLAEILMDETPGQTWARFRFLAPQIARHSGTVSHEAAGPDMDHLCETLALPYLAAQGLTPARVVISLSDRLVPFGAQDPAATQFFETYRPAAAGCIWEAF